MSTDKRRPGLRLAGGRILPRLLFVTNRHALVRNVGAEAVTEALALITEANEQREADDAHVILDDIDARIGDPFPAMAAVHKSLLQHKVHGVVILGGYDAVPPVRFDCLPRKLRAWVDKQPYDASDPDDFIVWCDDPYADPEHVGLPTIPISRIPDGHSAALLLAALRAPGSRGTERRGMRNVRREYVDQVFEFVPGEGQMLKSAPHSAEHRQKGDMHAAHVYLVLHGRADLGSTLWGEHAPVEPTASAMAPQPESPTEARVRKLTEALAPRDTTADALAKVIASAQGDMVPALRRRHMPGRGAVILSGACWSAQASVTTARFWRTHSRFVTRTVRNSVALTALRNRARAFVGSTGLNYSPMLKPYRYWSEPLHRAFWIAVRGDADNDGAAPARALLEAKHHFALGMPHGHGIDLVFEAIEHKTLHQYTCLGLGW